MAKLDRPLYGEYATGTLARALAFRNTFNPPDPPGQPVVTWGAVSKIPIMSCRPSLSQIAQRLLYTSAVAGWNALSDDERSYWNTTKPSNLTGFNFWIQLFLLPNLAYFGFCLFGSTWFQIAPGPDQPSALDYDQNFPTTLDEFPTLQDGAHSPQAWLFNRSYETMLSIQNYLLIHKSEIEA